MLVAESLQKFRKKSESSTKSPGKSCIAALLATLLCAVTAEARETYDLTSADPVNRPRRVQVALQLQGELRTAARSGEPQETPLSGSSKLVYDEQVFESVEEPWKKRSLRHYHQAGAELRIGDGEVKPELNPDRRTIVARISLEGRLLFSPLGPLRRRDLDLLEIQADSLLLSYLLPPSPVQLDEHWKPADEPLAFLLGIEVVTQSDVRCRLVQVDGSIAEVDIRGKIQGAVGGIATEIELKGKVRFDRKQRCITRFVMNLQESRDIGHAEPGLDVTAQISVDVTPIDRSEQLERVTQEGLPLEEHAGVQVLDFQARNSRFQLLHDRRWRSMLDRHDLCILRFIDRGDLVAQCNISELPPVEAGKHLSLESFQADVQRTLGNSFGQIVEASQTTADSGNRVLRVLASGNASDVAIVWVYYHVSSDAGRRAALAFTLEADLMERFAENDQTIVDSFEFRPRSEPAEARRPPASPKR